MNRDLQYRQDILEAIEKIWHTVENMSYDDFLRNVDAYDACVRRLEIIGEAVKRLSPELKTTKSHIPWKEIAGFRDKAIHDYASLNTSIVWETIKNDLLSLYQVLKQDK
ncbi:MAG: HepT-like ribonuclease domain-containing protein [Parcubacteria group bacterium]|jgi:uncharacterized protein with HEPN domain